MTTTTAARVATQSASGLAYIPALDGIRALAVLAVMSFHFGQDWIPGGFIGVDVFFVLSGFLITTLLVQRRPEPFSVTRFWLRRARRLFPALALMLVAVSIYAYTTPALEQSTIRGQGLATLFYVNNWWLLHTGVSYFDAYQSPSPLLHTWSLSVEEQWYLLFPLLVLGLVAAKRFALRAVGVLCALLAAASMVWTILLAWGGADPNRLYLSTDTRAQQLLVGAILAVVTVGWLRRHGTRLGTLPARSVALAGWLGLVGLAAMVMLWQERTSVPVQLVLASVFSALLIVGALGTTGRLANALAWEPLRRIGVISYGLYLWHWPISVIVTDDQTNAPTAVRLALTFMAATVSYVLVERPVRSWSLRRVGALMLVLPLPLFGLIMASTPKAGEASTLQSLPEQAALEFHGEGVKVFAVGDSVAGSLWQPLWLSPRLDVAISGSLLLGCPPIDLEFLLPDGTATELGPPPGTSCGAWLQQWRDDVRRLKPDVLLVVASSQLQFDVSDGGPQQAYGSEGYRRLVLQTLDRSVEGLDVPRIVIASPPCTALGSNPINDAKNDRTRTAGVREMLLDYAQERGYGFVDLSLYTCFQDPAKFYFDGIHFTKEKALSTWDWLAPQITTQALGPTPSATDESVQQ
jgi:peptidoglycan/LPS O-acetylase OafA/YrhL